MLQGYKNYIVIKECSTKEDDFLSKILINNNLKKKDNTGVVVSVGFNVKGELNIGDLVLYSKYSDKIIKNNGEEFICVEEKNILLRIDKGDN